MEPGKLKHLSLLLLLFAVDSPNTRNRKLAKVAASSDHMLGSGTVDAWALNDNVPKSAGVASSQCCSKLAPKVLSFKTSGADGSDVNVTWSTVKLPVRVLHPRFWKLTSSPGCPGDAKSARSASA